MRQLPRCRSVGSLTAIGCSPRGDIQPYPVLTSCYYAVHIGCIRSSNSNPHHRQFRPQVIHNLLNWYVKPSSDLPITEIVIAMSSCGGILRDSVCALAFFAFCTSKLGRARRTGRWRWFGFPWKLLILANRELRNYLAISRQTAGRVRSVVLRLLCIG